MSKPVLGRKLGTLLEKEAGKPVNPTLLRDGNREAAAAAVKQPTPRVVIPLWYWLAADLLLVALGLLLVFTGSVPVNAVRRTVAVGVMVLGGALAAWAVYSQRPR